MSASTRVRPNRASAPSTTAHHGLVQSTSSGFRDALRRAVDDLGGPKTVGSRLKPDEDPVLAAQWVSHCLTHGRREKFSLEQISWIFRQAHALGEHAGMSVLNASHGYTTPSPIHERDVMADLSRKAETHLQQVAELSLQMRELAKHMGLKLGEGA